MFTRPDLFGRLSFTRHGRIEKYLQNLELNITLTKIDKEVVDEIKSIIQDRIKSLKSINVILIFLYIGVYFSFVSIFFRDFYFLERLGELIKTIVGIFGTTVFIIAIYFVNKLKELHYGDLNLLTAHIIAIYNNKFTFRDQMQTLTTKNDYEVFIGFFRKRGFKKKEE